MQQLLQKPVNMSGLKQIHAARDMSDGLYRIVDDNRDMIARADIPAGENHIAPAAGICPDPRSRLIIEEERCREAPAGLFHVDAQAERFARGNAVLTFGGGEPATCAGIKWIAIRIGRAFSGGEGTARAETRIEQFHLGQTGEGGGIIVKVPALEADGRGPSKPQPRQILNQEGREPRRATNDVDVLHAQEKDASSAASSAVGKESGIGMAEMKLAVGAWGKAIDRAGHKQ